MSVKNPYRYRGYRYDTETGLYYLQSRYYNAEWGRFINADALGGSVGELLSHNVFAYCKNNPVNYFDPNGFRRVNASLDIDGCVIDNISSASNKGNNASTAKTVANSCGTGYETYKALSETERYHKVKNGGTHEGEIRTWKVGQPDEYNSTIGFTIKQVAKSAVEAFALAAVVSGIENYIDCGYQVNKSFTTGTIADILVSGSVGILTTGAIAATVAFAGFTAPAWVIGGVEVIAGLTVNGLFKDELSSATNSVKGFLSSIF